MARPQHYGGLCDYFVILVMFSYRTVLCDTREVEGRFRAFDIATTRLCYEAMGGLELFKVKIYRQPYCEYILTGCFLRSGEWQSCKIDPVDD